MVRRPATAESERYVICNADESEPGTFKDREIILRQCHKMLEGLAIAAYAVEAKDIFIYIRGEYVNEIRALEAGHRTSQRAAGRVCLPHRQGTRRVHLRRRNGADRIAGR